jgi:hypothetical protein
MEFAALRIKLQTRLRTIDEVTLTVMHISSSFLVGN